jgi:hypothetical protein
LKLIALCLEHRGSKESNLLPHLNAAEDLGIIEIADSEAHYARRVHVALFHKYVHRAARATRTRRSTCCATSESAGTTRSAASAAATPAG